MATAKVTINNRVIMDITDTTATAETIRQGYTAYGADGAKIIGTYQGGGGVESVTQDADGYVVLDDESGSQIIVDSLSITQNGTYTAPTGHAYSPVTVNISGGGGGGLEFEEGTVTISSSMTTNYDIQFTNTHTKLPSFYLIKSAEDGVYASYRVSIMFALTEDTGVVLDENNSPSYGMVAYQSIGSTSYANSAITRLMYPSSNLSENSTSYPRYWATESRIRLPGSATYQISGTYKWIAIWED